MSKLICWLFGHKWRAFNHIKAFESGSRSTGFANGVGGRSAKNVQTDLLVVRTRMERVREAEGNMAPLRDATI